MTASRLQRIHVSDGCLPGEHRENVGALVVEGARVLTCAIAADAIDGRGRQDARMLLKEVKGVNGRPAPHRSARNPKNPKFWWGSISAGGDKYARFVGSLNGAKSKTKAMKVHVAEAVVNTTWVGGYRARPDLSFWTVKGKLYEADPSLTAEDVFALAMEGENKKRLRLEKAHSLMAMTRQLDERAKRQSIPQDVKVLVWQRDSGRCVECGSQKGLEYDHIIPLSMGGSDTDRNLQLLCADCNRRKGGTLG